MSEIKFEPCPFCGCNVAILTTAKELEYCKKFEDEECACFEFGEGNCNLYTVVCNYQEGGCGASCGYFTDSEKAIKRWNTRGVNWRSKNFVKFMENRGLG